MSADLCTMGLSASRHRSLNRDVTPRARMEGATLAHSRKKPPHFAAGRAETVPGPAIGAGDSFGRDKVLPHTCYKIAE